MLDRILPTLPPGFTMTIPFDDGEFIADSVWNVFRDMITGTALWPSSCSFSSRGCR